MSERETTERELDWAELLTVLVGEFVGRPCTVRCYPGEQLAAAVVMAGIVERGLDLSVGDSSGRPLWLVVGSGLVCLDPSKLALALHEPNGGGLELRLRGGGLVEMDPGGEWPGRLD